MKRYKLVQSGLVSFSIYDHETDTFARLKIDHPHNRSARGLFHYRIDSISNLNCYEYIIWSNWSTGSELYFDKRFEIIMESVNYKDFANIREQMPELFI